MTWTIQTREPERRFRFGLHLGHPTRWPQTDQPGIYMAPHSDAISAMHFPIGAADVWVNGPPGWRLVCAPRRKPIVDVCRRWAHESSSRHRHSVFAPTEPVAHPLDLGIVRDPTL